METTPMSPEIKDLLNQAAYEIKSGKQVSLCLNCDKVLELRDKFTSQPIDL